MKIKKHLHVIEKVVRVVARTQSNKNMKPIAQYIGILKDIEPPHIVATQEKILTPVGTAITIVAAVKYARVSTDNPTVYI